MKFKIFIIFLLLVIGASLFYWFQIRPSDIKIYCDKVAWNESKSSYSGRIDQEDYNWKFTQCLHSQGLK